MRGMRAVLGLDPARGIFAALKMPRNMNRKESLRNAKAKRDAALERVEIGLPTAPRESAGGVTSMATKIEDPEIRRLIDEALARKR